MKNETYDQLLYDEILVDAYGEEEKAMSWFTYADEVMQFPFKAKLALLDESRRAVKVKVQVLGLKQSTNDLRPLRVEVLHAGLIWTVELAELRKVEADAGTAEVVGVYGYWVGASY